MNCQAITLPALAALALLAFAGCSPNTGSLRRHVESKLRLPADVVDEAKELLRHYERTGDVHYATPQHRMTMLHLAAQAHELTLVKALLREGADPNALMLPLTGGGLHETPLSFTMANILRGSDPKPADSLAIIEQLLAAGAQMVPEAPPCTNVLTACAELHANNGDGRLNGEELVLKLMDKGAKGGLQEARLFATYQWMEALARLLPTLAEEELAELRQDTYLWQLCASWFDHSSYLNRPEAESEAAALTCASTLLKGIPAGEKLPEHVQESLCQVAHGLAREEVQQAGFDRQGHADFIALLLQHGADAYAPTGRHGKSCAADELAADAEVCARLRDKGCLPEPPAHRFSADTLVAQLLDIPAAAIRAEEVAQQAELLSALITAPTEAQLADMVDLRRACAKALALLCREEATRSGALKLLAAQPAWSDPAAWEGEAAAARNLLYALQEHESPLLPVGFLVEKARAMLAAGRPDVAHAFACLLAHDPAAASLLDELAAEGSPAALRAAALSCQLRARRLVTLDELSRAIATNRLPSDARVLIALMASCGSGCDREEARLRSPERLYFTGHRFEASEVDSDYTQAFRKLGAPRAAAFYAEGKGDAHEASLELETAYALYVLAHEEAFRNPETEHNESKERFPLHVREKVKAER